MRAEERASPASDHRHRVLFPTVKPFPLSVLAVWQTCSGYTHLVICSPCELRVVMAVFVVCILVPKVLMFFECFTTATSNMKDWKWNKYLAHSWADSQSSWTSDYMSAICFPSRCVRNSPRHPPYSTTQYLSFWRDRFTHKYISVIIHSTLGWWKVGWSLNVQKTILELHSKHCSILHNNWSSWMSPAMHQECKTCLCEQIWDLRNSGAFIFGGNLSFRSIN